jgi:hypothetical protein
VESRAWRVGISAEQLLFPSSGANRRPFPSWPGAPCRFGDHHNRGYHECPRSECGHTCTRIGVSSRGSLPGHRSHSATAADESHAAQHGGTCVGCGHAEPDYFLFRTPLSISSLAPPEPVIRLPPPPGLRRTAVEPYSRRLFRSCLPLAPRCPPCCPA